LKTADVVGVRLRRHADKRYATCRHDSRCAKGTAAAALVPDTMARR
jgi:hypothetical protein